MYENAAKIHRIGNAITPKSFETFYLKIETSNLKPVFTLCENCKLVSYELLRRKLSRNVMARLGWVGPGRFIPDIY